MRPLNVRPGIVFYAGLGDLVDPGQVDAALDVVLGAGFQVVELSTLMSESLLERASGRIERHGASLYMSAGPELGRAEFGLSDVSAPRRRRAVARVEELVDLSARLGAENLMLASGRCGTPCDRGQSLTSLRESLHAVADHAWGRAGSQLSISLESFAPQLPPHHLVGPTEELLEQLHDLGDGRIRVTIDVSHLVLLGEDVLSSVGLLASHSTHLHLATCVTASDHPLFGDMHPSFDEPGIALDLDAASGAVRHFAQLKGAVPVVVSTEVRRHHGEHVEGHVAQSAAALATALDVSALHDLIPES
jgi:sugar phosphate isomerase/epimerase